MVERIRKVQRTLHPSRRFTPKQSLVIGFSTIILLGALLLMLPVSNRNGEFLPFLNALFTSASATCVTGLVVYDTWTQFSMVGQFIIMVLIQIGGLGFMTIAILFSMVLGKRIGLRDRSYLMEAVNAMSLGGVVKLVRRILIGTVIFEAAGAFLMAIRFIPIFGWAKGVWYGIFHSVSAFCNAGFDLMGSIAPYSSFTHFTGDILINGTLITLIVAGGIGFVIWDDVTEKGWNFRKFNLHTKITIVFTGCMILSGTFLILVLEWNTGLAGLNVLEKFLAALFQSVTPRTAGFNTIDTAGMSEGGTLLTILLMIIGAGPGSTAGGIKITTFAVMAIAVFANLKNREDANTFARRLPESQVRRAFSASTLYLIIAFAGCILISAAQPLLLKDVMFEVFSAIGTVGLSMGITRDLIPFSRMIIILIMYAGRVGSITVFLAMAEKNGEAKIRLPEERIIV